MASRKISQREARRLLKQVEELQRRERARLETYGGSYPGGVHTLQFDTLNEWAKGRLWMARQLGCVFVAKYADEKLHIYAVPREPTP